MSGFAEAFAAHEDLYKAQVMAETWGYPQPNVKYPGWIIWTHGIHGDIIVINLADSLPGDPFFYEDLMEFICDWETEEGHIYRFDGYYIKHKKGSYRFTGKVKEVGLKE
jgi:hypothetical protein